jgi:aminopeptidase
MKEILRLDRDDPVQAWWNLAQASVDRCRQLNGQAITSLHMTAPGTDLTLGCIPAAHWEGGTLTGPNGIPFIPNLPTEEVFTTPDWRRTEGRASVTRPVQVMGKRVKGAWFEFRKGRVEDFGADDGTEQLAAFFDIDDRGRYLGEVALVDAESPIFQSGLIFSNILYDENAACHIALGSGYPLIASPEATTPDEKQAMGINQSLVHTDFMIGCPEMDVTGTMAEGQEVPILRQGRFTPPFN